MGLNLSATRFAHLLGPLARSSAARADDDGDDAHAEDDGDDDEARAADDDHNNGDKDRKDDARKAKHPRLAERARCAQIFRCAAAGKRPDVAAHLAFDTDMHGPDTAAAHAGKGTHRAARGRRGGESTRRKAWGAEGCPGSTDNKKPARGGFQFSGNFA